MNKELIWTDSVVIPTGACAKLPFNSLQLTYKLEDGQFLSVVKLPFMPKKFTAFGKTQEQAEQNAANRALVHVK